MPTLLRDSHFVLERYVPHAFIRLARTAEPLHTHAQAASSLQACRIALGDLDPTSLGILIDWRLAPLTVEAEALQQSTVLEAEAFAEQFARKAVLLLTPVGPGPTQRAALVWGGDGVQLFHDEEAALDFVSAR